MEKINDWLKNSKAITEKSKDPYRSNFQFEFNVREKMLKDYKPLHYEINKENTPGTYKIMGQNPDDPESCYIGNVIIEFEEGVWLATWYISGFIHNAYGLQVSPNILVFNFSYTDDDENLHTGLVSYTFLTDSIVHGEWIEEGFSEKGLEELRKLDNEAPDGDDSYDGNFGFSLN